MHVKKIFFPLIAVAVLVFSGCEQPADPVKNDNPGTNTPPAVESRYTLKSLAGTLTSGRVNTTLVLNDDGTGTMTQAVSPLRNGDFTWGIVKMAVQESSRATVSVDSITITPKEYPDETFQMQILEINGKFSFKVTIEGQSIYFDSDATPPAFDIDPAELTLEAGAMQTLLCKDAKDWISENPEVATVENGMVTALKKGVVFITATSKYDPERIAYCKLTVTSPGAANLPWNDTYKKLPAVADGTWGNYGTASLIVKDSKVTWVANGKKGYLSYTTADGGRLYFIEEGYPVDDSARWNSMVTFVWTGNAFATAGGGYVIEMTKQ